MSQCQKALQVLFDPTDSKLDILERLSPDPATRQIRGKIRVRDMLQFPRKPFITAYESKIVYTVQDNGLIAEQSQVWSDSKSATKALQESFTLTLFTPPPYSLLAAPVDEPTVVTQLFQSVNGRRPGESSHEERFEITRLMDQVASLPKRKTRDNFLSGQWMLVYLQPSPTGQRIHRRIPFPEFDFNDNFQTFTDTSILNRGENLGPNLLFEYTIIYCKIKMMTEYRLVAVLDKRPFNHD